MTSEVTFGPLVKFDLADALPGRLASRHLALESAVIVALAHRLVRELGGRDPLAERVVLSKAQTVLTGAGPAARELLRRALGRAGPRATST